MRGTILEVIAKNKETEYDAFIEKINTTNIFDLFDVFQITSPAFHFRREFAEYVLDKGYSALFSGTALIEDVTTPSMPFNEVEDIAKAFVKKLEGAKRLLIIDPYFFAKSSSVDVSKVFKNLISPLSNDLEEICFIDNKIKRDAYNDMRSVLDPKIKILEKTSDEFHDRFWIDPDNSKGIFMGTSLNGLGKKFCLIDTIKQDDAAEIIAFAKGVGAPI